MTTDLILPKFNMDMDEAVLLRWLVSEGDRVEEGQPVAEVETDKVNMEVEATAGGILFDRRYAEGDSVPVTATIARIAPDQESVEEARIAAPTRSPAAAGPASASPGPQPAADERAEDVASSGAVTKARATPAVRRLARSHRIDLAAIAPNGGRVTAADVRAAVSAREAQAGPPVTESPSLPPAAVSHRLAAPPPASEQLDNTARQGRPEPAAAAEPGSANEPSRPGRIPLHATRRVIADRMALANEAPQITLYVEVRAGALSRIRGESRERPSFSAIFAVAVARALHDHPNLNVTFEDGEIVPHAGVDLGIAVARPNGLIVPVIRDADRLNVVEADLRIRDLVARAREGRLRMEDVTGGTFTITSLGEAGIDYFAPLLNPPQVGILGIGRLAPRPVAVGDGLRVEPTVHLSLSCDHRVIDGAPGAAFLSTLRGLIESPAWLADNLAAAQMFGY